MLNTVWATVRDGRIELLEAVELQEGARMIVTILPDEEAEGWVELSESALAAVWDNAEDDIYAELLET